MEREKEKKKPPPSPSYNGRRCPKIPASRPKVVPPTSLTPQPRNLPLHSRIHLDDMAESKRSPTASGESNHLSKEKYRHKSEEGPSCILCTPALFYSFSHKTNIYIYIYIFYAKAKKEKAERGARVGFLHKKKKKRKKKLISQKGFNSLTPKVPKGIFFLNSNRTL